ncbi:hypothetical protein N9L80_05230 [Luminiphilus sp.]|nr:hypothetical protein [Luminiphilus sp.]
MLLLITGSVDGTADRLVHRYGDGIFRLNHDLLEEYDIEFTQNYWSITSPAGLSITSKTVSAACWWKAFSYWKPDLSKYAAAEARYLCRDLYGWCRLNCKVIGNPPDFHNRYGKMTILGAAAKYFLVPDTLTSVNLAGSKALAGRRIVAKSLASETSEDKKVLLTTEVDIGTLHPKFVWYLQEAVQSQWDVTVFYCDERCFGFRRDRSGLSGLDWREAQSFDYSEQEWFPFELDSEVEDNLRILSAELDLEFGRYDFMLRDNGELAFLEVNANGQWVFLDINDKYGLLDWVVGWMRKSAA